MTRNVLIKHGQDPQQMWREAMRNMLAATLTGAGVGSTVRGLQGLLNLARRNIMPAEALRKPSIIMLPRRKEEKKVAQDAGWIPEIRHAGRNLGAATKQVLGGEWASNVHEVPGYWSGLTVGGAGGLYGGWKLLDWILDRRRKQETRTELEKARGEYEEALASQSKIGCALNRELDHLYELAGKKQAQKIEKAAQALGLAGKILNGAALLATMTGIPTAVWVYKMTKARQPGAVLRKARQRYRRVRETASPTPVLVSPAPLQGRDALKSAPDESELEGSPLGKTSQWRGSIVCLAVSS